MDDGPDLLEVFDRLADRLLNVECPSFLALSQERFLAELESLRSKLDTLPSFRLTGNVPLCLAAGGGVLRIAEAMACIKVESARGCVEMTPRSPQDFQPIEDVHVPSDIYLLIDVDTGRERLNVNPEDSLKAITEHGRTPLTQEEGVMLTVQYPQLLTDKENYNCIQMPGSRIKGDQRVPSIWFSKGAPRLGWCWNRNVHTWLATASAAYRLAA